MPFISSLAPCRVPALLCQESSRAFVVARGLQPSFHPHQQQRAIVAVLLGTAPRTVAGCRQDKQHGKAGLGDIPRLSRDLSSPHLIWLMRDEHLVPAGAGALAFEEILDKIVGGARCKTILFRSSCGLCMVSQGWSMEHLIARRQRLHSAIPYSRPRAPGT